MWTMILPIYIEPQPVLHQETTPITEITPEIKALAENMRETMHNAKGIGLAAPQIGQSLSMCVIEIDDPESEEPHFPFTVLINPRITWKSTKIVPFIEACLSIPGTEGKVMRPDRVRVKAKNLEGETFELEADGLLARVVQHEIDHLHGILFTKYVPKKGLVTRKAPEYPRI